MAGFLFFLLVSLKNTTPGTAPPSYYELLLSTVQITWWGWKGYTKTLSRRTGLAAERVPVRRGPQLEQPVVRLRRLLLLARVSDRPACRLQVLSGDSQRRHLSVQLAKKGEETGSPKRARIHSMCPLLFFASLVWVMSTLPGNEADRDKDQTLSYQSLDRPCCSLEY